jgi:large-conductance mechanosensitive channel
MEKNITIDGIRRFISGKDLLNLVLAVYLGRILGEFFTSIVDGFIMPLMMLFVPGAKDENVFNDITVKLYGRTIQVGDIIVNAVKLFVGVIVAYTFVNYFVNREL